MKANTNHGTSQAIGGPRQVDCRGSLSAGRALSVILTAAALSGCVDRPPVHMGGDTYFASRLNKSGVFGSGAGAEARLISDSSEFCAKQGEELQLVTEKTSDPYPGHMGGAQITFKCVMQSGDVVMRPDHGVTTVQHQELPPQ